jgi:hypothetical protein
MCFRRMNELKGGNREGKRRKNFECCTMTANQHRRRMTLCLIYVYTSESILFFCSFWTLPSLFFVVFFWLHRFFCVVFILRFHEQFTSLLMMLHVSRACYCCKIVNIWARSEACFRCAIKQIAAQHAAKFFPTFIEFPQWILKFFSFILIHTTTTQTWNYEWTQFLINQ